MQIKHITSAIIGYWRSGLNVYEIVGLTELDYFAVKTLIQNHENNNPTTNTSVHTT